MWKRVVAVFLAAQMPVLAMARDGDAGEPSSEVGLTAEKLARALDHRLTVWRTPSGEVVHVRHCREGRHGCSKRIAMFAQWIAQVAREHELDEYLLAAVALRESGLNPDVKGSAGERGIVQLHPKGVGHGVRYVESEIYRRRCRQEPGACQRKVLEAGAEHLANAVEHCDSLEAALGAYNTGRCVETPYARRVLEERARLRKLVEDKQDSTQHQM